MKFNLVYLRRLSLLVSVLLLGSCIARTLIHLSLPSLLGVIMFILATFFLAEKVQRFEALSMGIFMGILYFLGAHLAVWVESLS